MKRIVPALVALVVIIASASAILDHVRVRDADAQPVSGGGLRTVTTNTSLTGSGTVASPLGLRADCSPTQVLQWNGSVWACAAMSAGVSDGDKGDITVSGGGATWAVDSGAVAYSELSGAYTTNNTIPKGTGTGLAASTLTDDGAGAVTQARASGNASYTLGDPISSVGIADVGYRALSSGDGNIYFDHKVGDSGLLTYRTGHGSETGDTRTWLEVTSSTGNVSFPGSLTVNGTLDADAATTLVGDLRGKVLEVGSVSGTLNNWAPTGYETATHFAVTGTGSITLTGLSGGADGRIIVITNMAGSGVADIAFNHESGSSTAANRFDMALGENWTIQTGESATFIYNGTSSRWVHHQARRFPTLFSGTITVSGLSNLGTISSTGFLSSKTIGTTFESLTGAAYYANVTARDTTAQAAGVGGGIVFEGYTDSAPTANPGGAIKAMKANSTNANTEFDLVFGARSDGAGDVEEACRIYGATKTLGCVNGIAYPGTAPTINSCGTGATITGNDRRGYVDVGTGSPATCVIDFAATWPTAPVCVVTAKIAGAFMPAVSTTSVTFDSTDMTGEQIFYYHCDRIL